VVPGDVDKWALVNLILSIAGVVLAVLMTVRALLLKKKEDKQEDSPKNANAKNVGGAGYSVQYGDSGDKKFTQRRTRWLIATIVLAIVGIVVFLVTEDMSLPRGWVDRWTIVNVIILVAGIITALFVFHNKKTTSNNTDKN
jgi:H+/gluconate symporter-like permease